MRKRSQAGIHSFEMVSGLLFLVPIVLYGIDYACVLYGGTMNSNACTAAARAAASGPPTGYATDPTNTPKARAAALLTRLANPTSAIRVKKTVRVAEYYDPPVPAPPFGGPFHGRITVKTRCDVFPPFSLPFVTQDVVLYTTQTYPITWVMGANYNWIPNGPGTSNQPNLGGGSGGAGIPVGSGIGGAPNGGAPSVGIPAPGYGGGGVGPMSGSDGGSVTPDPTTGTSGPTAGTGGGGTSGPTTSGLSGTASGSTSEVAGFNDLNQLIPDSAS